MTVGSLSHIILFAITAGVIVLGCVVIRRLPKAWQTVMIVATVLICCGAIFHRYAMNLSWSGDVDLRPLLMQQLQVCNFNFTLLLLALIPRLQLPRQYAFFFSMFAASTTLFALNSAWGGQPWYAPVVFNSWLYHSCAVAAPLFMWSAGWIKPHRRYIAPVSGCVVGYFTVVYIVSEILKKAGIMSPEQSFSYIYKTDGIPILDTFHKWFPAPYWHLYLSLPIIVGFFFLLAAIFNRRITFEPGDGIGKARHVYGVRDDEVTLPDGKGMLKVGCVLAGWRLRDGQGGEKRVYAPGEVVRIGKKNATYYAVWTPTEPPRAKDEEHD